MKHVTIEAVVIPGFSKVMFKVKAQTHRNLGFGTPTRYGAPTNTFTASNGITLVSNNYPARDTEKAKENVFYLQGANRAKDDNAVVCCAKKFAKVKAAIEEYNRVFAVQAPAPRRAAPECGIIVG